MTIDDLKRVAEGEEYSYFAQMIAEELVEMGWTTTRLALEMGGGDDYPEYELAVRLLLSTAKGLTLGQETADRIGSAFGVGGKFIMNLWSSSARHEKQ